MSYSNLEQGGFAKREEVDRLYGLSNDPDSSGLGQWQDQQERIVQICKGSSSKVKERCASALLVFRVHCMDISSQKNDPSTLEWLVSVPPPLECAHTPRFDTKDF